MNVDAQRIRLERERRAWTQAQLAGATGLGLRTVQRIERVGSASFESVQAIAAVLELTIAELRLESVPAPNLPAPAFPFWRLVFASLSGVAVWFWFDSPPGVWFFDHGPLFSGNAPYAAAIDYLAMGCLFAAAVLIPELPAGRASVRRALGLVLASALSIFTAVAIADEVPNLFWTPGISSRTISVIFAASSVGASIVGAAVVLAAAHWLIGMDRPLRFWVSGMIAAVLGGFVVGGSFLLYRFQFASFAIWHLLLCVAIQMGRGREIPLPSVTPLIRSARAFSVRALLPGGRLWRLRATPTQVLDSR